MKGHTKRKKERDRRQLERQIEDRQLCLGQTSREMTDRAVRLVADRQRNREKTDRAAPVADRQRSREKTDRAALVADRQRDRQSCASSRQTERRHTE